MRYTATLMATIDKAITQPLGRPPSAKAIQNLKAQNRGLQSNSSPVYKTQTETSVLPREPNVLERGINRANRRLSTGVGMKPVKTLDDVSDLLRSEAVKNIVVVAGAGISTPSGIPDFRTPGTGLYDNLQQYRIPYPEAIFDIEYFHHNPKPFFTLAKELFPSGKYRPNYIHYFLRMLYDKGMLLRMYTQNIDGLERMAGLPPEKLVEAHGTFASATCTICGSKKPESEVKDSIFKDRLPKCLKRGCPGIVKPDIVFFGEDLPQRFYLYLRDMLQTDLVIVMGTSLEVQPFAGIIDTVKYGVPRVLFNWNAVGPFRSGKRNQDVVATGDLIGSTQKFAEMTGWKTEMEELIVQNEGSFLVCSPEYAKQAANKPKPRPNKPQPIMNAFWRNRMESSSEESSSDESSSDSSSEDEKRRYRSEAFRRRGVRSTGSMKNNMGTATIRNGVGSNRLLKDIKKNGTTNTNGQKRDFTTRVPSVRSPAPISTTRSDKYMTGRNSVSATRPPTKYVNGKITPTKPSHADKTKVSPEKLTPLPNKTKVSVDKNAISPDKTKVPDKTKSAVDNLKESETVMILSSDKDIESDVKITPSDKTAESDIKKETILDTTVNLSDNTVPSLDRTVVPNEEIKLPAKTNKWTAEEANNTVNTNDVNKNISLAITVDSVKAGIDKLVLSDNNSNKSMVKDLSKTTKNAISNEKKCPPKDTLLTTRSEPGGFYRTRKLNPAVPENNKNKVEKVPINTVKSDLALSAMSPVNKNTKEMPTASNKADMTNKNGKIKNTEKVKRAMSERNLRKKDKNDKKRSVSAKAKVALRLLHNRYAKNGAVQTSNTGDPPQNATRSDIAEQPYVDLIGTLKREKPLDVGQNITDSADKTKELGINNAEEITVTQNDSTNLECPGTTDQSCDHIEDINRKINHMSLSQTLPDDHHVCSDSDKVKDLRRKKFSRKPPQQRRRGSKELKNTLNPVPYGYATPRMKRLMNRAMIPANVCSGYELPSEYVSPELLQKLAPPNHVKLAYRHNLQSTSPIGTQVVVREDSNNSEIVEKPVDIC